MIASMVVVIDKGIDLLPEITGQVVVFQQDAVLEGLMPSLDLTLGLRVIWRASHMVHLLIVQPFVSVASDPQIAILR